MKYNHTEYLLQEMLCEMPSLNGLRTSRDWDFRETLAGNKITYRSPNKVIELPNMFLGIYNNGRDIEFVGYRSKTINDGNAIVYVGVTTKNKFELPLICYAETLHTEKNKGYMSTVYKYIIETYGGIISDDEVSENMSSVYTKLIPQYNSYIIDHKWSIIKKITQVDSDTFKSHKEMILLSTERLNIEDWNSL